ncbi:MAG: dihydrodipicolinate synthase family protein [Saprospiraceae bacterium]|nr:dihydrodipicolinate synthase family protein [Saprospiraceae bacterium]
MKFKFSGLVAAPFTPFTSGGVLNLNVVPVYAELLKLNEVQGAFICGSTGEGVSLTNEERKQVMEAWSREQTEQFKIIMSIGTNSVKEGIELAKYAKEIGLYAISILPPFFFKEVDCRVLIDYCREISRVTPNMPIYYYHIPILSGVNISMLEFLELASKSLPGFAGIKFSEQDLVMFRRCILYQNGKYEMMWGVDGCLLAALSMGARSAVGSTYNYIAPIYTELISQFRAGNMLKAQELQDKSIEVISVLNRFASVGAGKDFMRAVGIECGEFRLPVKQVENKALFAEALLDLDFNSFCSKSE